MNGDDKPEKSANKSKKRARGIKWPIVGVVAILIIIVACIAVFTVNKINIEKNKTKTSGAGTHVQTAENVREDAISKALSENNPKAAISIYQKNIDAFSNSNKKNSSSENKELSFLYLQRAEDLYSYGGAEYKTQILTDVYKAEEIYPSAQSATMIYDMESKFGNTTAAQKYLVIMDERTKNDPKETGG